VLTFSTDFFRAGSVRLFDRRLHVVARASAKGELSTVLGANKQLTELLGLAEPARSEVSVSVAEIDREIARLEDQIAAQKARQRR